ncbi:hypothetical protein [Maridesulfovibrio sp.]|uniref:hypothetical protein n=1 Tax=Maridesulfovibrio sp. TaxID=2795000 RepID=UPI002AA83828|nr:hypothetical protein [Maridesulfovibrio sp.]
MGKLIRSTINIAIIDLAVIVINGICFIAIENNFSNLLSHFEVLYSVPTYTGLLTFIISIRIAKSNCSENIKVILEKLCTASLILMAIGSMLLIYSEIYFHIDKTTIIPHIIVSLMFIWLGIANIHNRLPYIQIILSLSRTPTSQSINEREIIAELHTTYNNDELVFIQQYLEKNFPKEQSLTKTITSHIITAIGILGVIIQTCQLFF